MAAHAAAATPAACARAASARRASRIPRATPEYRAAPSPPKPMESMRVELTKEFTFEAAHRLPRVPADHKCFRMHGHGFRVEIVVAGSIDLELGWLVDYADITAVVDPIIRGELDHR